MDSIDSILILLGLLLCLFGLCGMAAVVADWFLEPLVGWLERRYGR